MLHSIQGTLGLLAVYGIAAAWFAIGIAVVFANLRTHDRKSVTEFLSSEHVFEDTEPCESLLATQPSGDDLLQFALGLPYP